MGRLRELRRRRMTDLKGSGRKVGNVGEVGRSRNV